MPRPKIVEPRSHNYSACVTERQAERLQIIQERYGIRPSTLAGKILSMGASIPIARFPQWYQRVLTATEEIQQIDD